MSLHASRHSATPGIAQGWSLTVLTPPSRLFGANGLRTGPDGRIYVAQVAGSQISAIDIDTGLVESISPMGGDIVAPDDLVFDASGNIYATEITEGRVSVLSPDGQARVVYGDLPCANPITMYQGRLFTGECRPNGRLVELDLNGGSPRVILDNVPMPNAMEVGPDGYLYFPVMGANEIWRVNPAGGTPEVVASGLGVPDAVKFDAQGFIVSTQVASGEVLRIDPRSGDKTVLATIAPGLDNLSFVGERLFVSSISGQVNEILADGKLRSVIPDGLQWPMGLAVDGDGVLFIADGGFTYTLSLDDGASPQLAGMLFTPGFPGFTRGVAAQAPGVYLVTTANGQLARWQPATQQSEYLAEGYERLNGVALNSAGAVCFVDAGSGQAFVHNGSNVELLASGLSEPTGVAISAQGACLVAEAGAGRIVEIKSGRAATLLDGLQAPHGILVQGEVLYIVDVGSKELIAYNLASKQRLVIATGLPVGAPAGVVPKFLHAIPPLAGAMSPFTGIAADPDGTLYVSADATGNVLAISLE